MQFSSTVECPSLVDALLPIARQIQFQNQISSYIDTFGDQDNTWSYDSLKYLKYHYDFQI